MKKCITLALCVCLLCLCAGAQAVSINFVTAGTSSTFYPISATLVKLWNDQIPGMRATATPSGGGVDNLNQAYDGDAQIGIANASLVYQAQEGLSVFEGYANDNLRIFAGLYMNPNQLVVTKASGIDSLSDLKGKKISVGPAGSTTIEEAQLHLQALGAVFLLRKDAQDLVLLHFCEQNQSTQTQEAPLTLEDASSRPAA